MAQEKGSSGIGVLVFTILALLFTGITAWLLAMMLSGTQYTKEPVKNVVVAKVNISPLTPITEENLKVVKMPESSVPANHFTDIKELAVDPPFLPAVQLYPGEVILREKLADPKSGRGLSVLIPPGMRAMVVRLEDAAVQARLFYPEATVDVIATVRLIKESTVVSKIIVQNVRVLAVGITVDPSRMAEPAGASGGLGNKTEEKDSVVTLLVTPLQAEQLMLAQREGKLDLVLRNQQDVEATSSMGAEPEDLFPELTTGETEDKDRERRESVQRILSSPRFKKDGAPAGGGIQIQ